MPDEMKTRRLVRGTATRARIRRFSVLAKRHAMPRSPGAHGRDMSDPLFTRCPLHELQVIGDDRGSLIALPVSDGRRGKQTSGRDGGEKKNFHFDTP